MPSTGETVADPGIHTIHLILRASSVLTSERRGGRHLSSRIGLYMMSAKASRCSFEGSSRGRYPMQVPTSCDSGYPASVRSSCVHITLTTREKAYIPPMDTMPHVIIEMLTVAYTTNIVASAARTLTCLPHVAHARSSTRTVGSARCVEDMTASGVRMRRTVYGRE